MGFNIFKILTPKDQTVFLPSNLTLIDALSRFDLYKFSILPMLDETGGYCSTISEGDLLRYIKNDCEFSLERIVDHYLMEVPVYRPYKPVKINASLEEVYQLILEQNFVPVLDDRDKFIGIIKRKDFLVMEREAIENN